MLLINRFKLVAVMIIFAGAHLALADDAALYREGVKQFQGSDYIAAGRTLSQLTPFTQGYGEQARYLLARVHDLCGERPEALGIYEAIIEYDIRCRGDAANALARADSLTDRPAEKERLEKLMSAPTPPDVMRSRFYAGRLVVEEGRFDDVIGRV